MNIWTTKKIKDVILGDLSNINLLNNDTFELDFFKKANFHDLIILEYYEGYRNFVSNYNFKGYLGLIILCDFKKGNFSFIPSLKTAILDVNKIGIEKTKELISFIINLHSKRIKNLDIYANKEGKFEEAHLDNFIEIKSQIVEKLSYCFSNKLNIIITIQVLEEGRKVNARGTGYIKDLNNDFFIIEKIRPNQICYRIKPEEPLLFTFPDKECFYEAKGRIIKKTDDLIFVDIPNTIKLERRKFVRVEPNLKNPVKVYIHIPGEENEVIDCIDISTLGISFYSQRELPLNGIYVFGLKTPYNDRFIISEGIIRNKELIDEKFRYGIELDLSEKEIDIVADYIRKREVEILDLLKD